MPQNQMGVRPCRERNRQQTYRPLGGEVERTCADIPEPPLRNDIRAHDLAAVDLPAGLVVLVDDQRGWRVELDVEIELVRRPLPLGHRSRRGRLEPRLRSATVGDSGRRLPLERHVTGARPETLDRERRQAAVIGAGILKEIGAGGLL